MLGVPVRVFQPCLEIDSEGKRALACLAERIELDFSVGAEIEVSSVISEEIVFAPGVPEEVPPNLPFRARIYIEGVFLVEGRTYGGAVEVAPVQVAHAQVKLGYHGLAGPRLEPDIQLVVYFANAARIGGFGRVVIEGVVVEIPSRLVADDIVVVAGVGGNLAAVAYEGSGDVPVETVRVETVTAVPG